MEENTAPLAGWREARETGCYGLLKGWAFSQTRRKNLNANEATHADKPFICPSCASPAVVRKCVEKINHFAHLCPPSQAPAASRLESDLHKLCRGEILAALQSQFPEGKWASERTLQEVPAKGHPEVRPDISGRLGEGNQAQALVIEVQASALSISNIVKRTGNYSKRRVPILWVIPIEEPLKQQKFRPWLYERFLHSIYYGRVYYWWPGMGQKVLPVHFGLAYRHIPESEFYDQNGEFQQVGDYDVPLKIIKNPLIANTLEIGINFFRKHRSELTPHNTKKQVPPCRIWLDTHKPWWNFEREKAITPEYYDYGEW